jgi:phage repressor protein C with HTH and peptisase S24 domain
MLDSARKRLKDIFEERSDTTDLKKASLAIGRNQAYLHQYLYKGVPKKLDDDVRKNLAKHLGIQAHELLPSDSPLREIDYAPKPEEFVHIPVFDVEASAGSGAFSDQEAILHFLSFRREWLRVISNAPFDKLSVIRVDGDSMEPTLSNGDTVLVDGTQNTPRSDGIYVLQFDNRLYVKRLLMNPVKGKVAIISDNPAYAPMGDIDPDELRIAGRVLWLGRRV